MKEKNKKAKKNKQGFAFTAPEGAQYEALRKNGAKKKEFKKLNKFVIAEVKKGIKSDVSCNFLFMIYRAELDALQSRLAAVKMEYSKLIDELNAESALHSADYEQKVADAVVSVNHLIADIDGMDTKSRSIMSLSELLEEGAKTVAEYQEKVALYDNLVEELTKTLTCAKQLAEAVTAAKGVQAAQNLYCDSAEEEETVRQIENACAIIEDFFGKFDYICRGGREGQEAFVYNFDKEFATFEDMRQTASEAMEILRTYTYSHKEKCDKRRYEDIEKLKKLSARMKPSVPYVGAGLHTVTKNQNSTAYAFPDIKEEDMKTEHLATVTLKDVLLAGTTQAGGLTVKNATLLSVATLKTLGLVSADTERVLIVRAGYKVIASRLKALKQSCVQEIPSGTVYCSAEAVRLINTSTDNEQ